MKQIRIGSLLFVLILQFGCAKDAFLTIDNTVVKPGWILTFNDEFEGTKLDSTKWIAEFRFKDGDKYGSCYKNENIIVKDGTVKLISKKEECICYEFINGKYDRYDNKYSSGMISSSESFEQSFGYLRSDVKYPMVRVIGLPFG